MFSELLHDADDKVRMEAPEIFRVLGKRRPEFVRPYVEQLQHISETDDNRVVRIHCLGAIKTAGAEQQMERNILQIDNRNDFREWLALHADDESECYKDAQHLVEPVRPASTALRTHSHPGHAHQYDYQ